MNSRVYTLLGLGIGVAVATAVFLYLHEWGHALGFWLSGYGACVKLNSTKAAVPYSTVVTLLGAVLGPLTSLLAGLVFFVAHFTGSRAKCITAAFALINLIAHPIGALAFAFNLLLSGKPLGASVDEVKIALMLPSTSIDVATLATRAAAVGREFLSSGQSLLGFWPLALLPVVFAGILVWKGRPRGGKGDWAFAGFVVVVILIAGQLTRQLDRAGIEACFSA